MQFSVYTYEVKMSRWLKNNIFNCKWTFEIWFVKDSTRFNETTSLQYAWVSNQRSFRKITSKARYTTLMQIAWGRINLIEWNIFLKKKTTSKHVGNVTEMSPLIRISVKNKLWKKHGWEVRQWTNQPPHTGPISLSTPREYHLWHGFLLVRWTEVSKRQDWNYLEEHIWCWCLSHRSTSSLQDLLGMDLNGQFYTNSEEIDF